MHFFKVFQCIFCCCGEVSRCGARNRDPSHLQCGFGSAVYKHGEVWRCVGALHVSDFVVEHDGEGAASVGVHRHPQARWAVS